MLDLLIIGAGPSGLACAIEAKNRGLSYLVVDKGSVVETIRRFPTNLTFFSTPELLEIGDIPFTSAGFRPTRVEALQYYHCLTQHFGVNLKTWELVHSIEKKNGQFHVSTQASHYQAQNVVAATGYFDNPNPFEVPGVNLPTVHRYYTEPYEYTGREVAVVGGKNSAVEVALDLFRHGANVTLIHRGGALSEGVKYWILPDIENRIESGEIKALFNSTVKEIREDSIVVQGKKKMEIPNDAVFIMIGYRPDTRLLESVGVQINPETLVPVHNPETMQTNVEGLFVAGSMAAGKNNNKIFIENGRTHGKLIVNSIIKN